MLAFLGVGLGVAKDQPDDLTNNALDIPGAALIITGIGLACYTMTSGVEHGWLSPSTLLTAFPMLDLRLLRNRTVRGATLAQLGTATAMAGVMFSLILHFQYAYGWSPIPAGLANLPFILTMLATTPLTEILVARLGRRVACLIGRDVPDRLAGLAVLGGRPRVPDDRHRHGDHDDRPTNSHDHLRHRTVRCAAEQPNLAAAINLHKLTKLGLNTTTTGWALT